MQYEQFVGDYFTENIEHINRLSAKQTYFAPWVLNIDQQLLFIVPLGKPYDTT